MSLRIASPILLDCSSRYIPHRASRKIILIGGAEANWFAVGGGERCYSWNFFFERKNIL
jgi:hypothetical protein